ncbi:MAG: (Fe-S)-binding protein [Sulfuriflexus sp.]|nr:(Fe-S)-binding protein [Sulfuriflexus sp.]
MPVTTDKTSLIAEADKCVLCGMCAPHCPTYSLAQNENESPRGRLVLGKAFLSGHVEATDTLVEHIDHCLLCRSCESSCPSGVKFGAFMDGLRSHLPHQEPEDDFANILIDQQQRRALNKKLWLGQKSGLLSIGKVVLDSNRKRLLKSLPKVQRFQELDNHYPAQGSELAKVMLFTGCNSELLGNTLVLTAIELLTRLGVSVEIPPTQECCGGLSRHHGDADKANDLELKNISAFAEDNIPILTLASGCGASLLDYRSLKNSGNSAESFASRVTDINHFLLEHLQSIETTFKPLNKKIVVHTPCSMKNVMRQDKAIPTLLKMIPELKVTLLNGQRGCCGAAGTYMYEQAESADALREPILADLATQQADILVTTNIGCSMHIQAGKPKAEILHPIELLAKQLDI